MPDYKLSFSAAGETCRGTNHENNEDNFLVGSHYKKECDTDRDSFSFTATNRCRYSLFAVFDGMGGGPYGEYASLYAAEEFYNVHMKLNDKLSPEQVSCMISDAFQTANNRIIRSPAIGYITHDIEMVDIKVVFGVGNGLLIHTGHIPVTHRTVGCGGYDIVQHFAVQRKHTVHTERKPLVTNGRIEPARPGSRRCTYIEKIVLHVPVVRDFVYFRIGTQFVIVESRRWFDARTLARDDHPLGITYIILTIDTAVGRHVFGQFVHIVSRIGS